MTDQAMRYSMVIRWSDEDQLYLVALPEWNQRVMNWNCVTHGETYEAAAANGREVLQMLIDDELENGEPLPEPQVFVPARTLSIRVPA